MYRLLAGLMVIIANSAIGDDALDETRFLNTDVFELEIAADPQISPDGSRVAYVRNSMDIMTDRVRSNIWVVDARGGEHRPVVSGTESYSSPRWSPEGDRLAYVSSAEGRGPELYVRWMQSGQTALLSNLPSAPSGIAWSPDGTQLAFSMLVKGEKTTLAKPPEKPADRDGHRSPVLPGRRSRLSRAGIHARVRHSRRRWYAAADHFRRF